VTIERRALSHETWASFEPWEDEDGGGESTSVLQGYNASVQ
jgi:hypothetical protein